MIICKTVEELEEANTSKAVQIRLQVGDESDLEALAFCLRTTDGLVKSETRWGSLTHLILEDTYDDDEDNIRQWNSLHAAVLLANIGELAIGVNLAHLEFMDQGSDDPEDANGSFPLSTITAILKAARLQLQTLTFNGVCLTGTQAECQEFAKALEQLSCLRRFEIYNNFQIYHNEWDCNIDDIVIAISKIPLAIDVTFQTYCWHEKGYPLQLESAKPLYALFSSNAFQVLNLGNFHVGNAGLEDVCKALKKNTTLRDFTLAFQSSSPDTSTKTLSMLADALSVNTTLEILQLEFTETCPNLDEFLEDVARALTKNTMSALTHFKIQATCSYGANVEKAFVKMLETANYTLEQLEIHTVYTENDDDDDDDDDDDEDDDSEVPTIHKLLGAQRSKIDMYLRLNRRGQRKYLMTNLQYATREKWVDTIATKINDLDALHYYLHLNPWLCHITPGDINQHPDQPGAALMAVTASPSNSTTMMDIQESDVNSTSNNDEIMDGTAANGYEKAMQTFQHQMTTCFETTNAEIQGLNRKHSVEKSWLEKEVLRLREENVALKAKMHRSGAR